MKAGDIVLIDLLQSDGSSKLRPALILKQLPRFHDYLVCGISTQLHQNIQNFDEILKEDDPYFDETGLRKTSLVRLFFLAVVPDDRIAGAIGKVPTSLLKDLCNRLASFIKT
jgi:mRNA interferase MazF